MGRPPAYIFIVRHGNRLDAADKQWHLSSPTPYDPPLTYGGWTQSRALGQRIGDILREKISLDDLASSVSTVSSPVNSPVISPSHSGAFPTAAAATSTSPPKRRYKVIIHSSPFLRCIQTSISIAAGLASDPAPLQSPTSPPEILVQASAGADAPLTLSAQTAAEKKATQISVSTPTSIIPTPTPAINQTVLRLDAFLGEWLSPGYFELITPPPSSFLMIASAKAELLRREDYTHFVHSTSHHAHNHGHGHNNALSPSSAQLWGASRANSWSVAQAVENQRPKPSAESPPASPVSLGSLSPSTADGRTPTGSSNSRQSLRWLATAAGISGGSGSNNSNNNIGGYVAPVPHFAVSSKAAAPPGYVAHARDACVDFDYQWDSSRPPHDWGDGGEYGEEWTAMHRRFRKGLQHLVDWYTTSDHPTEPVTRSLLFKTLSSVTLKLETNAKDAEWAIDDEPVSPSGSDDDGDGGHSGNNDDYTEESVVILVSHGAGCNAMIGAITQQPVLMDVGLSSLTVAERRPGKDKAPSYAEMEEEQRKRRSRGVDIHSTAGGTIPLQQYYEIKLYASTDHLRSASSTPSLSRSTSRGGKAKSSSNTSNSNTNMSTNISGSSMAAVMGGTRNRHSNSLSSALGSLGFSSSESGGILAGNRSTSAGSGAYGSGGFGARRSSGNAYTSATPSRYLFASSATNNNSRMASGGITVGSGVTSFMPPAINTVGSSRLSHERNTSVGLWSPISATETMSSADIDVDDDSDMELLLSFGPESLSPRRLNGSAAGSATEAVSVPVAVPDIKFPPSRSCNQSTNSAAATTTATVSSSAPQQSAVLLPQPGLGVSGLWGPQRLNDDEPERDMSSAKRRWTVTERPT